MLPKLISIDELPITQDSVEEEPTISPSFLFDFEKGDFVLKDGKLVKVIDIAALKIWIQKTLRTELDRYKIYSGKAYGAKLEDLTGQSLPQAFVESEIEREVTDALLQHPAIVSLTDFEYVREKSKLLVSFTVNLPDGTSFEQEVNY